MRPTGALHIGHYFGALSNWLKMQEEYDCFYFVADWHALTTHYADTSQVASSTLEVATDWLAVGLDPAKCTIFVQSFVPEHAELHLLLSMITPVSWLERVPTYKEQIEQLKDRDLGTYGFLGYPLLQSADIVMYGERGVDLLVPVGEDQVPHVELTREIVRRFNTHFAFEIKDALFEDRSAVQRVLENAGVTLPSVTEPIPGADVPSAYRAAIRRRAAEIGGLNFLDRVGRDRKFFALRTTLREPTAMLTETPRLPGTDGRRMAKSYGNAIWLGEPIDSIREKVRNMMTDPQRVRRTDPGRPEVCPVFYYHKLFSDEQTIGWADQGCRTAGIGCVDCKAKMAEGLIRWIEPIQARRRELEANPQRVWEILDEGSAKARRAARATMRRVRKAIFDWEQARKLTGESAATIRKVATGD